MKTEIKNLSEALAVVQFLDSREKLCKTCMVNLAKYQTPWDYWCARCKPDNTNCSSVRSSELERCLSKSLLQFFGVSEG